MDIKTHATLPQTTRTAHVDLTQPCHLDPSVCWRANNKRAFNNLLNFLQLTNNSSNRKQDDINLLHHCENDTLHGCCANPYHLSYGTHKENVAMIPAEDRSARSVLAQSRMTPEQRSDRVKRGHETRTVYHRPSARYDVLVTSPDGVTTQISGVNNAAKFIGCGSSTVKSALSRSGTITKGLYKNWSIKLL